ncbi:LytR C-terminal domain-containing protein [Tenggerimyces flavus]|uniref:LytR C-terminal domain-containing protein n=1 Tax=Tenggerimyces flavus TaxID=1708749 RepID=A0ABV7Y9W2_9ACTN|nr:LytR C-terminal domain-containing protein [Tenggerimyces flavus]MBM7783595.1 hypothetical protein [Tenggerimyces flavus]
MAWDTGDIPQFRKRRNIRGPITLVLLIGLLGGAAYYGWTSVLGRNEPAVVAQVCTTPSAGKQLIASKDVIVNVYNAGKVRGAGANLSEQLELRGFKVADLDNDPLNAKVGRVEIRGRAKNAPEVLLVLAQVKPTDKPVVKADGRQEATVDFVIGDAFGQLKAKAPKQLQVKSALPVCTTPGPTPAAAAR